MSSDSIFMEERNILSQAGDALHSGNPSEQQVSDDKDFAKIGTT